MAGGVQLRSAIEKAWWSPRLTPLALALWPVAMVYRAVLALRRLAYAGGLLHTGHARVRVIVVGNLVVGGAGKTPTVIALVEALRRRGWTPGVISRGHGSSQRQPRPVHERSTAADVGDEPLLIRLRTGAPVWVGRDRPAVARALCDAHADVDLLIADDGLQHLALARDVQVVVFDARGYGNGLILPAGPLREARWATVPARSIVVYNGCDPSTPLPGHVAGAALHRLLPLAHWWTSNTATAVPVEALRGRAVLAAAGVGNPERFFAMLEGHGLRIQRWPLPDHAPLDPRPWPADAGCVVVTEKDAVKLAPDAADADRILVATLDFALPEAALTRLCELLPTRGRFAPPDT